MRKFELIILPIAVTLLSIACSRDSDPPSTVGSPISTSSSSEVSANLIATEDIVELSFSKSLVGTGNPIDHLAIIDIENDGDKDIIVISEESGSTIDSIIAYVNTGSGAFVEQVINDSSVAYAFELDIADLDGDGLEDIIVSSLYTDGQTNGINWYKNDSGFFSSNIQIFSIDASNKPPVLVAEDIDLDNDLDLHFKYYASDLSSSYTFYRAENDGEGQFTISSQSYVADSVYIFTDLNNDQKIDLIGDNEQSFNNRLAIHDDFSPPTYIDVEGTVDGTMVLNDFNGDGIDDLLYGGLGYYNKLSGNSLGTLDLEGSGLSLDHNTKRLITSEFNNDLAKDLVGVSTIDDVVFCMSGNNDFGFPKKWSAFAVDATGTLDVADFNGDGRIDFVVGTQNGLEIHFNQVGSSQ